MSATLFGEAEPDPPPRTPRPTSARRARQAEKADRRNAALIHELLVEVREVCTNRGGFGYRIRRQQALMLRAAQALAKWGPHRERRQMALFENERNAA
jgi:hypothetical protein